MPVSARRSTWGYTLAKFVRRNRLTVGFASIALVALLAGLSIAVWQAYIAKQERARAEGQATETRRLANSLLNEYDEELGNLPGSLPIRTKLAKATSDYLDRLVQETDDPTVLRELAEAHLHWGGISASHLGSDTDARKHYQRALELSRRVLADSPEDLSAKELVAKTLLIDQSYRFAGDERYLEAMRLREEIVLSAPSDSQALHNLAGTYLEFGIFLRYIERRDDALAYFRRAIDTRQRQIAFLERDNLTPDEYSAKFWAFAWTGLSQGSDFDDWQTARETLQKGLEIAEIAAVTFPDHQRTQTNIHTAHSYLARALNKIGDYRGALAHYELALDFNKNAATRFNLFWHGDQVRHMLKIAEMLQKNGRSEQSLTKLREALALRREATAVNHADPRTKHSHAGVFLDAGKLFAAAGKSDEALAAYREAEEYWQQLTEIEQDRALGRLGLANANMHIGDIFAGCPPDGVDLTETNRARLLEAFKRYEKAVQFFAENRPRFSELTKMEEKLAQAKLAACKLKLSGG
ncbi:MAG: tetratricopeptide repeat protein [Pyrinomonadaceae bacterium]